MAVVVIGETPYAEGEGDSGDLSPEPGQIETVKSLYDQGFKVVTILISGRPLLLEELWHYSDAVIAAWLPGTEAAGLTDILFGDYEPSGKLSFTWPASMEQIPINTGDSDYDPFFPYGFGIDTFALPPVTRAPKAFSAAIAPDGSRIEITFDKAMDLAPASSFDLRVNNLPALVTLVEIKEGDPNTLLITGDGGFSSKDLIVVSSVGGLAAGDGSLSGAFSLMVLNNIINYHAVPGKIEAEDYYSMSGIQTENCSDTGGGLNVGYIEANDHMVYKAEIAHPGVYTFKYRVASETAGKSFQLQLKEGSTWTKVHTISFDATGGYQNWITVKDTAMLPAGRQSLRILSKTSGFNLNWFEITEGNGVSSRSAQSEPIIQIWPNPANDILHIESSGMEAMHYVVYTISGWEVARGYFSSSTAVDISGLSPAIYMIRLEDDEQILYRKIVVN